MDIRLHSATTIHTDTTKATAVKCAQLDEYLHRMVACHKTTAQRVTVTTQLLTTELQAAFKEQCTVAAVTTSTNSTASTAATIHTVNSTVVTVTADTAGKSQLVKI